MTPTRRTRWILVVLALVVLVVVAIPVVTAARIWHVSRQDDRTPADVAIVLGAAQFNGVPSPVLESRLLHAKALYDAKAVPKIMTVGGKQPGDNYTEAEAGKMWLTRHGVPSSAVIAVQKGDDTQDSMKAAALSMKKNDMSSAIIVTDPDHSLRARTMARDLGIAAWTSPARYNTSRASSENGRRYVFRETGAYLDYVIFRRPSVKAVL